MPQRETPDSFLTTRRGFIQSTALLAGGLALGIRLPPLEAQERRPAQGVRDPAAFVRIAPDDTITLIVPCVEMGQGAHTALPMIVMEELEGDWSKLRVVDAPAAAPYNNPMSGNQSTVGSFAVRGWYQDLRKIGAAAKEMLIQAAAAEWGAQAADCVAASSIITHRPTGRTLSYGKVAIRAATLPVPQNPTLKAASEFKVIGTSKPRVDTALKVDGSAQYGIDVRLPDMLYAAVKTCPTFGGKLKSFDDSEARNVKGFVATVPLPDGVITVAQSYWQARQALDRVKVEYDLGRLAGLDSARVFEQLRAGFEEEGVVGRNDGDALAALRSADRVIEAVYEVPYLAHTCMEPMNCTAHVTENGCEVWTSTQSPQNAQRAAAQTLGIAPERVKVVSMFLGGGFGRRGESDYVVQAVLASRAVRRPVKLVWSREEDIQHDFYRPAAAIRFRAGIDAQNRLAALDCHVVSASAPGFNPPGAPFYTRGVADTGYGIPNFRVVGVNKDLGVRFGFWRSVNHSHNPYMLEAFLDEVARATNQDPYRFRRSLLAGSPHPFAKRQLQVLDAVAEKAGWGRELPAGRFRGITAFEAYGSWVGNVAEVSVANDTVTLHRVVCAIDCGVAVNPHNIQAQMLGGMVYGLSAAVRGEITLENGAVMQSNFHDYPMLRMGELPKFELHIVKSDAPPGGIGEPGTAPIAPALVNAVFAATGKPVRSLPLSKHGFAYAAG